MDYPMTFGVMARKSGETVAGGLIELISILGITIHSDQVLFSFDADSRLSSLDFQASASCPLLASVRSLVLSDLDDLCISLTMFSVGM
jgi:hypothetical protein